MRQLKLVWNIYHPAFKTLNLTLLVKCSITNLKIVKNMLLFIAKMNSVTRFTFILFESD